ncbi:HAD hydrolase-like protein [Fulvimarina sp. 2208YS6-2-32]|uniref:Phosphoglycolate phosphatase n=1 Tax=Fulvimarina uroteuthidis TaxID=3098149 RepID=A0ABU5HWY6_9HYPH|nr:HAD family hydrolase [Fulvimarina sp. 2208YS6-2-32]MDY8107653.1 HAD hydrolase-like protein [Fulvimarina sp. 2208YS6-2-32]
MTKLAVFDLDGTLVDTAPDLTASLNMCLAADRLAPLPVDLARPHAGHGARKMLGFAYGHHGRDLPDALADEHLERFLSHYEANIADLSRPFPGVVAAMDRLSRSGWSLAVCTNKRESLAVKLLDALDLSDRFVAICGQDTFAGMKPDPAHLGGTIDRARVPRDRVVMIGDTMTDVAAARALCVPCILMDFGHAEIEAGRKQVAAVLTDYDQLTPTLADALLEPEPSPAGR